MQLARLLFKKITDGGKLLWKRLLKKLSSKKQKLNKLKNNSKMSKNENWMSTKRKLKESSKNWRKLKTEEVSSTLLVLKNQRETKFKESSWESNHRRS